MQQIALINNDTIAQIIISELGQAHEVLELVATHASGPVYRIKDNSVGKTFLLRILTHKPPDSNQAWENFEEFAKKFSAIKHPKIQPVLTAGFTSSGFPYIISPDVEGETLSSVLHTNERLSASSAIDLALAMASSLKHAHELNVNHKSVCPDNIFVRNHKERWQLTRIIGFEIEPFTRDSEKFNAGALQDPHYISPEQCEGEIGDRLSDIYSVGCILYHMLTGRPPYTSSERAVVLLKHTREKPATLHEAFPEGRFPVGLPEILFKCMEKDPQLRYKNFAELEKDLQSVRAAAKVLPVWLTRHAVLVAVVTVFVASVTVSTIWFSMHAVADTVASHVSFTIPHAITDRPVHRSTSAKTLRDAVQEAVSNNASLEGANLKGANLSGMNLKGAKLKNAFISGQLIETNLSGADLRGATLDGCNAAFSNFDGAKLGEASVNQCNFANSTFTNVETKLTSFKSTNIEGANTKGTIFGAEQMRGIFAGSK